MNRDKQIEDMAKVLNECCNRYDENGRHLGNRCYDCEYWCDTNHCCCSYNTKEAEALYTAGYRKASEVARGIFEEIDRMCIDTFGNFNHRVFAELKKKYTEGEG